MVLNCGVREDSWESLGLQGDPTSHPKGDQSWVFIGRTDVEKLIFQYFGYWCEELTHSKDPDAGKDWGQEEKGTTEDEMVAWHLWLKGHEFEQAPGDGGGQGGLACCSPWDRKESDTNERLNWSEFPLICHLYWLVASMDNLKSLRKKEIKWLCNPQTK